MGFYPFRGPDASFTRRQSYHTAAKSAKSWAELKSRVHHCLPVLLSDEAAAMPRPMPVTISPVRRLAADIDCALTPLCPDTVQSAAVKAPRKRSFEFVAIFLVPSRLETIALQVIPKQPRQASTNDELILAHTAGLQRPSES